MAKQSKAKMQRDQLVYKAISLGAMTRIGVANLYHWTVTDGRCSEVDAIMSRCQPAKPSKAAADKAAAGKAAAAKNSSKPAPKKSSAKKSSKAPAKPATES